MSDFSGAKLVLLVGAQVVTILRDNSPDIPFPDMWDFPGGGREGDETPESCVLRETQEELSLSLSRADLIWKRELHSPSVPGTTSWWFAAKMPIHYVNQIRLGDEGQRWELMHPDKWLADPRSIPHFKDRLRAALAAIAE